MNSPPADPESKDLATLIRGLTVRYVTALALVALLSTLAFFGLRNVVKIEEKPSKPTGNWIIAAPYIFDNRVFDLIKKLKPSARGELEIADLLSLYIELGLLKLIKRKDFWLDVGTFDSLLEANQVIGKRLRTV